MKKYGDIFIPLIGQSFDYFSPYERTYIYLTLRGNFSSSSTSHVILTDAGEDYIELEFQLDKMKTYLPLSSVILKKK